MTIFNNKPVAGHSGQNSTVKRSEMKLSKIAPYSVSLAFLDVLLLPDPVQRPGVDKMIVRAALAGASRPLAYKKSAFLKVNDAMEIRSFGF